MERAKYIVDMLEECTESAKTDSDFIEAREAIAQYERKLKKVAGE